MKSNRLMLLELARTIPVQQDGVMELPLSQCLSSLAADTMGQFTGMSRFVPPGAHHFLLSITVTAIGDQIGLESSTSTTQPGESSPTSHLRKALSLFTYKAPTEARSTMERPWSSRPSPTHLHEFESGDTGNPTYEWCRCGLRWEHTIHVRARSGGVYHEFVPGGEGGNCAITACGMPREAFQHTRAYQELKEED